MRITVRLFARLRDIVGTSEFEREVPDGFTAGELWDLLATEQPELKRYHNAISTAVNEEYDKMDREIHEGDEVAFLPPVSGG